MTDLKQLAQNLRNYNAWRRGDGKNANIEMPHPIDLGTWIDSAIAVVEAHAKSNVLAQRVEKLEADRDALAGISKELIERLREAAAQRVASTAMIGADDLIAAADALEIATAGMNAYCDELGSCRKAAGFGSADDPMAQEGVGAFSDPLCVAAFVESQFKRIVAERDALAAELKALREQELLDALKSAKNWLEWYQDAHPESASECDSEAMQKIDAAIARAESAIETPTKVSPCAGHATQQDADLRQIVGIKEAVAGIAEFFEGEYHSGITGIVDASKVRGERVEDECRPEFDHYYVTQGGGGFDGDDFHGTVYFHIGNGEYATVDY